MNAALLWIFFFNVGEGGGNPGDGDSTPITGMGAARNTRRAMRRARL
jgi:hypothetical protein